MSSQHRIPPDGTAQIETLNATLADIIGRWTVGREDCATSIPNLVLFRREAPSRPRACKVEPSLVVVVQWAKQLLIGDHAGGKMQNRVPLFPET